MLISTIIQDIFPSFPPESLRDYAFYSISVTTLFRIIVIFSSYLRWRRIMPERKQIKAVKLVGQLEIPGLKRYISTEIMLIILPPIIAIFGFYLFGLGDLKWSNFPPLFSIMGIIGLSIWIMYEIYTTIKKTRRRLNSAIDKFESFLLDSQKWLAEYSEYIPDKMNPFPDMGDPENYIYLLSKLVNIRRYARSKTKWARNKSPDYMQENIFPILGGMGKTVTQSIQYALDIPKTFVENTVANVSEKLIEKINKELSKLFPVTQTTFSEAMKTILRSAAPTLWLCLLVLIN